MKTHQWAIRSLILGMTGIIMLASCNKDDNEDKASISEEDAEMTENGATSDALYEKSYDAVDENLQELDNNDYQTSSKKSTAANDMNVTVNKKDSVTYEITLDYGNEFVNGWGDTLSGKIVITQHKRYLRKGSERTVDLDNLMINGYDIRGQRNVQFEGYDSALQTITWNISLTGGEIIKDGAVLMTREVQGKTRTRYFGPGIYDRSDDYIVINGQVSGTNLAGNSYTRTFSKVKRNLGCWFFSSGTITIQSANREDIVLDYGNGTCDRFATISQGSAQQQINLRRLRIRRR